MKVTELKLLVFWVLTALLTAGFLGSQWAAFTGSAADWAVKVDQPQIKLLALAMLLVVIVLAAVPENKAVEE